MKKYRVLISGVEVFALSNGRNIILRENTIVEEDVYLLFEENYRKKAFKEVKIKPKRKRK